MKHQALLSSKDKSKKLKCRLLQFLFGALRVNSVSPIQPSTGIKIVCHSFMKNGGVKKF